jgi:hypothetical protein
MSKPWFLVFILCGTIFLGLNSALSQESYSDLPDSPSYVSLLVDKPRPYRETSWKTLPRDFLHDQKNIRVRTCRDTYSDPASAHPDNPRYEIRDIACSSVCGKCAEKSREL